MSPARPEEDLYIETDFSILYEDEFLLAVDKPAPLPVHRVGAFKNKNLLSLLQLKVKSDFLAPVNRLDSETSGVVIFARTSAAAGKLGIQFENRSVEKEYLGFVFGKPVENGKFETRLGFDESRGHRRRVADPEGEEARTDYERLEYRNGFSLMRILPHTGRMHQIRAHFALAGHPLAGDKIYIKDEVFESYIGQGWQEWMREIVKWPRLALHASGLKIRHPETNQEMKFSSVMPASLQAFWKENQ